MSKVELGNGNSAKQPEISSFEDILKIIGTTGRKNVIIFIACGLCALIGPFHSLSYQFLGATPDYWCYNEVLIEANWTTEQIKNISHPYDYETETYDSCNVNVYDYETAVEKGFEWSVNNVDQLVIDASNKIRDCTEREFDPDVDSIVTQWDLVCERRFWYASSQSAVMVGLFLASVIFGYLLDSFGRRPVMISCIILYVITGFLTPLSNHIILYIVLKMLTSCFGMGFYLGGFIIAMELCLPNQRSMIGNFYPIPWALGYMIVPVIAYFIRPWKLLQVALTVPSCFLLANVWILPESPRWLILNGRYNQAYDILKNIADSNKRDLASREDMEQHFIQLNLKETTKSTEEISRFQKFKKSLKKCFFFVSEKQYRLLSMIVFFCWFSVSLSYYGVSLGSDNIEVNTYLYIFIGGLTELPAYVLLWPTVVFLGRKKTLVGFFILGGILIITVMSLQVSFDEVSGTLLMVLSLTGKVAFTAAFQLVYVVTAELYPTHLRSLAVGMSSFCGKVGSAISPYINDLLGYYGIWIPSAVFGVLSLLSGFVSLYIPETSDTDLPEGSEKQDKSADNKAYVESERL